MEATLKDIANATGFSINTVSRSLRNDRAISEKTKKLIKEKADELNYIPNALASSMRSLHSGLVGVISADSTNPFFGEVIGFRPLMATSPHFYIPGSTLSDHYPLCVILEL